MPLNESQEELPLHPPAAGMGPNLRAMFAEEEVPDAVVLFLEKSNVFTGRQLGFHAETREELKNSVFDQIPEVADMRWVLGRLVYIWHLARKKNDIIAAPVASVPAPPPPTTVNDEEVPMCLADVQGWQIAFENRYGFKLSPRSTASPRMLSTIHKFIQNKTHVFISPGSARSFDESSALPKIKRIKIGDGLMFEHVEQAPDWRNLHSNYQFLDQLELILVGGYALVGNFARTTDEPIFAPLQAARDYIEYVKARALPYDAPHPPLHQVQKADAQTRCLWTEAMRQRRTLGQAMHEGRMQTEAFWLFACSAEAARISTRVRQRSYKFRTKHPSARQEFWQRKENWHEGQGQSCWKRSSRCSPACSSDPP